MGAGLIEKPRLTSEEIKDALSSLLLDLHTKMLFTRPLKILKGLTITQVKN